MNSLNKTFLPTTTYQNRNWFLIDCRGQKLGRLATTISILLKGKMKPHYHPSGNMGDYVILIHADSIIINQKSKHYLVSNPGRPGHSLRIKNVSDCLPEFTIAQAVKGMLSKKEKKKLMKRLTICKNQTHPHQAQKPIEIDVFNLSSNSQLTNVS